MTTAAKTKKANQGKKASDVRKRVQLDFTPKAFERLQALKVRSESPTHAETVRQALRLFEWFLDQQELGSRVQVTNGQTTREVTLLL